MAYQGLASVLRPDSNTEELKKKAAKVKAKASSTKSIVGNVVGLPAAGATAYFTGSPSAAMAAYQAGKGIGEGGVAAAAKAAKAASAAKKAASWLQFLKA